MVSVTEYGNTVEFAMIAVVKDINKDLTLRIFAQPNEEERRALCENKRIWKITKITNK